MNSKIMILREDWNMLSEMIDEMEGVSDAKTKERLEELKKELQTCLVVDDSELPTDLVTMYSTVEFRNIDSGELLTYKLTTPYEAEIELNRISVLAPVGTALLGYRAGDIIEWKVPSGTSRFKIEKVIQP